MRRQCRQQKHQGKRNGNQRGPHLRDFFRAELVGQATGQPGAASAPAAPAIPKPPATALPI